MQKSKFLFIVITLITFAIIIIVYIIFSFDEIKNSYLYFDLKNIKEYNDLNNGDVSDEKMKSKGLQYLAEINSDLIGWIKIDGTSIDYPVMQSEKKDYYLNHSFYKEYSVFGVPYVPCECQINDNYRSDNIIIYGHHIKYGKMFTPLDKYKNKSFYEKHKYIQFDTLEDNGIYEVVYVFTTTVYDDIGFKYYEFIDAKTDEEYENYIKECENLSLYDCDVEAAIGDELLTLSTCEYSQVNGRLVIVAKKIKKLTN